MLFIRRKEQGEFISGAGRDTEEARVTHRRAIALVGVVVVALAEALLTDASAQAATSYAQISSGDLFTCALTSGDGVQCWGTNDHGQLGDGTTISSDGPVNVKGLTSGVSAVSAGWDFACALTSAGGVKCWGDDAHGQLGTSPTTYSDAPVQVSGLTSHVSAISAGGGHACAIVSGAAECWGYNNQGQLGNGSTTDSDVPVQVSGLTSHVTGLSAGFEHTCAVISGAAQCWGYDNDGQLGNGSTSNSDVPVQVSGLTSGVSAVSSGYEHTCAVVSDAAECWGLNLYGQLGNNSTTNSDVPVQVSGLTSRVSAIAAGNFHSCAVISGDAMCWGYDEEGQLGNDATYLHAEVPVQVYGLTSGVSAIAAGGYHTCAVLTKGASCWGSNTYGQLGSGTTSNSDIPVAVAGKTTLKLSFSKKVAQGASVTFKISVSGGGHPAGTVDLYLDGTLIGSGTLDASGKASITVTVTQPAGTHQVWAVYGGNPPCGGSHNVPKKLTVT